MFDFVHFVQELGATVEAAEARLRAVSDERAGAHPAPERWSAKQILGHLIDSAANNHRRFVEAQLKDDLVFPGYDQEQWVAVQHYQQADWPALVTLWAAYNRHLLRVIASLPAAQLTQPRAPHTLDRIAWQPVSRETPVTLEYLIRDYGGHLKDHLNQILAMVEKG